ncbi:transposase family protein [Streptomyces sp. NPDC006314]|uniref:helix-turn-helix domain-containing protein n=1 Tax=Streptomyces sp. NPDC006314 TaxID=3154475 RepID=UPI0033AE29DF
MRQFERLLKVVRDRGGNGPGGGRPWCLPLDDRVLLVAVYYRTHLTMRQLAPLFGVSPATVCRVTHCGHDARRPGPGRPVPGGTRLRPRPRQKGGELAGPSPVDRGKPGSKMHILSDANGLPYASASPRPTLTTASD